MAQTPAGASWTPVRSMPQKRQDSEESLPDTGENLTATEWSQCEQFPKKWSKN
jgi:hypothetical protein